MRYMNYKRHLIPIGTPIRMALERLNELASDAILFVCNEHDELLGSLTDGDVRRGLLKGASIEDSVETIIQAQPKFYRRGQIDLELLQDYRTKNFRVIPLLEEQGMRIVDVINFRLQRSYLPIDVVLMAGGKGMRLRPLTNNTPKPMLPLAGKPIIEHHLERLKSFGMNNFYLSVNYLAETIQSYFKDGQDLGVKLSFVHEADAMGTIGSVSLVENWQHDFVLIANSDLLTNVDYEQWFSDFVQRDQDFSILTIPYIVDVPYAILETELGNVKSFKEKPTYTYEANGGMYLIRRKWLTEIPKGHFDATDLIQRMIDLGVNVGTHRHQGYWLDIGRHEDYSRAQRDIDNLSI